MRILSSRNSHERGVIWKITPVAILVLAAVTLAACSSGGGGGGGGDDSGGSSGCGDATTCTGTAFTLVGDSTTAAFTAIGGGTDGDVSGFNVPCSPSGNITVNGTYDDFDPAAVTADLSLSFNACRTVTGADDYTINGPFTVTSTFNQTDNNYGTFTMSSSGLSISGTVGGNAVNFSCALNINMTFSASGYAFSSTVCGETFTYP